MSRRPITFTLFAAIAALGPLPGHSNAKPGGAATAERSFLEVQQKVYSPVASSPHCFRRHSRIWRCVAHADVTKTEVQVLGNVRDGKASVTAVRFYRPPDTARNPETCSDCVRPHAITYSVAYSMTQWIAHVKNYRRRAPGHPYGSCRITAPDPNVKCSGGPDGPSDPCQVTGIVEPLGNTFTTKASRSCPAASRSFDVS